jgi:hypothetical protein
MCFVVGRQSFVQSMYGVSESASGIRFTKRNSKVGLFDKGEDICLGSQLTRAALIGKEIMA